MTATRRVAHRLPTTERGDGHCDLDTPDGPCPNPRAITFALRIARDDEEAWGRSLHACLHHHEALFDRGLSPFDPADTGIIDELAAMTDCPYEDDGDDW